MPPLSPEAGCRYGRIASSSLVGSGAAVAAQSITTRERPIRESSKPRSADPKADRVDAGSGAPAATDEQTIASLLEGESDAVAEVRRWIRGASSPYRRRLAADLEDLEQQVLLELVQSLRAGRFLGDSKLSTYVRRMAHYKCLNRIRDSSRRQWVDVDEVELVADSPTPFERAAGRQAVDRTLRVLARMPEGCRELWRMLHDGLSYSEMGERIGVAPGTLRVRVLRCRQKALAERDRSESLV